MQQHYKGTVSMENKSIKVPQAWRIKSIKMLQIMNYASGNSDFLTIGLKNLISAQRNLKTWNLVLIAISKL